MPWSACTASYKEDTVTVSISALEHDSAINADEATVFVPAAPSNTLSLDDDHFAVFRSCYPEPLALPSGSKAEGKAPREWYAGGPETKPAAALTQFGLGVNRAKLIEMRADATIPTLDLCIAILAWGGMHGSNRTHLFKCSVERWLDVAERVRAGRLTREAAFDAFAQLNHDRFLIGMGPAYYTKLIYFLMPRGGAKPIGYIMDQWLGCSVNLICAQEVVRMETNVTWTSTGRGKNKLAVRKVSSRVSPLNTGEHYDRFCRTVESVAERMGREWSPDAAELALMSRGGSRPAPWRKYVVENRLFSLCS
jgi:hypothetical protein